MKVCLKGMCRLEAFFVVGCRIDRIGMARPIQPNKQPYIYNERSKTEWKR